MVTRKLEVRAVSTGFQQLAANFDMIAQKLGMLGRLQSQTRQKRIEGPPGLGGAGGWEPFGAPGGAAAPRPKKNVIDAVPLEAIQRQLALAKSFGRTKAELKSLGIDIPYMHKRLGKWQKASDIAFQQQEKRISQLNPAMKRFRMEYLSTMFFGMQVWRLFGGIFKGMIQEYRKLDSKGNKPLTRSLIKMSAAFTFLKFSILDAMGPALGKMINWIADLADWLSDLDPAILAQIGWGIGIIATAGLAMFSASQIALFADSVSNLLILGGMKPETFKALGPALGSVAAGIAAGLGIVIIGWAFNKEGVSAAWDELKEAIGEKDIMLIVKASFSWAGEVAEGWHNFTNSLAESFGEAVGEMFAGFVYGMKLMFDPDYWRQIGKAAWAALKEGFTGIDFNADEKFLRAVPDFDNLLTMFDGFADGYERRMAELEEEMGVPGESFMAPWTKFEEDDPIGKAATDTNEKLVPAFNLLNEGMMSSESTAMSIRDTIGEIDGKVVDAYVNIHVNQIGGSPFASELGLNQPTSSYVPP